MSFRWKSPAPAIAVALAAVLSASPAPHAIASGGDTTAGTQNGRSAAHERTAGRVGVAGSGSLHDVVDQIEARELWNMGFTGAGVNVAVIDTGVSPVTALSAPGKIVASVDLSGEADDPEAAHLDTNGHGTHIAGIIAGNDPGGDPLAAGDDPSLFMGVAPDAGIVSVKVADRHGDTGLMQVIAAVDWVVEHADELDIGVLNLSYSSGSPLAYRDDPLTYALEQAWMNGIVVVTAAGNGGDAASALASPANDPYLIAVGAAEVDDEKKKLDFDRPDWASVGDETRAPDVAAPGTSIESLRVPGSFVDEEHSSGRVDDDRLFRGSGTSQSAAVVSGAAALLLEARPELTPDELKELISRDTVKVDGDGKHFLHAGLIQLEKLPDRKVKKAEQTWPVAEGGWELFDAASDDDDFLDGIFGCDVIAHDESTCDDELTGARWSGARWSGGEWDGARWSGGEWMGARWSGARWSGARWSGARWSGARWSGARWSNDDWSGARWSNDDWSGARWSGARWSDVDWP